LRERKTYNKCYKKFADFKREVRGFFYEDIPKIKNELTKRINDNFPRIQINNIMLGVA